LKRFRARADFENSVSIYAAIYFIARLASLTNPDAVVVDKRHYHANIFLWEVFSKKVCDRLIVVGLLSIQRTGCTRIQAISTTIVEAAWLFFHLKLHQLK
jgi:hypothetical protein